MQRVTNCVIRDHDRILMLQKPRRGWWYVPGGKMETEETILESVVREVVEETGISIQNPEIKGIFTIVIKEEEKTIDEWMLFTFFANTWSGSAYTRNDEGELRWVPVSDLHTLPMPEGDRIILAHACEQNSVLIGRFTYTPDYQLISYEMHTESNSHRGEIHERS